MNITVNNKPLSVYLDKKESDEISDFIQDKLSFDSKTLNRGIKSRDPLFGLYRPSKPSHVKIKSEEGRMTFYKFLFFLLQGAQKDGALIIDLVKSYHRNYNYDINSASMRSIITGLVRKGYVYKKPANDKSTSKTSPIKVFLKEEYVDMDLDDLYSDFMSKGRVVDKLLSELEDEKIDSDVEKSVEIDFEINIKVNVSQ